MDKAKVILLSTFHFANPAKDLVQNTVKDVLSQESQQYLSELSERLAEFRPSKILLEYDRADDQLVNDRFRVYRNENSPLAVSEIEQLGFRVAKMSGLNRVESFDERQINWSGSTLLEQLKYEPELEKRFFAKINELTEAENERHTTLSLREILKRLNCPELDDLNKGLYILTNMAGVDYNFAGADAAASWWHRNFRMLARIQKFAKSGERLIVVGGQGHIAVLRDLIKFDQSIQLEDTYTFL